MEGRAVTVLAAEHVFLEDVEAVEEALLTGVHFVEQISAQQQKIHFLGFRIRKDFLEGFKRVVVSYCVLFFVAEVDVGGDYKSDSRLH
jgi:hypothetical protein